ncbi:MAG: energy transducer TonB [Acidobacteriota bacterium]|nr:energy transducer TonB [Acidobacteriota bacterium]
MKLHLAVALLVACISSPALAAADSLQAQLEAQYRPSQTSVNGFVPGAVLVVQVEGIEGVHAPGDDSPTTTYRNGVSIRTQIKLRSNQPNGLAPLAKGERVYVRGIVVNPQQNWVEMSIMQCGACTGAPPADALQTNIRFEFAPGVVQSGNTEVIEADIEKVLSTHQPAATAERAPPSPVPLTPEQAANRSNIDAAVKAPLPPGVYVVGGDVTPPKPVYIPSPPMPRKARRAGLSGTVVFVAIVDAQGNVKDLKQTSPPLGMGLDESASATLRTWKFKPAARNGTPVSVRIMMEAAFR